MSRFIIDASVAIKWFVLEELREEARSLRDRQHELLSVDHAFVEVANGLLRKVRRNTYAFASFADDLDVLRSSMEFFPAASLIEQAASISNSNRSSVYDSLYVALALQEHCQLVTADEKLVTLLRPSYPETLLWLGDVTLDTV